MRVSVNGEVPATPDLTLLERTVLETALGGARPELAALRGQVDAARVVSRTPSGVGFVTRLEVPPAVAAASTDLALPPVTGTHPALREGAEFLLQVKNGRLHSLEAYCFEGMWPQDDQGFTLTSPS